MMSTLRAVSNSRCIASTKLSPPNHSECLVDRNALINILDDGANKRLVTLVAAAGTGKTQLLSQWYHTHKLQRPIAWLSLDPEDNCPNRFYDYLFAALQRAIPGIREPLFQVQGDSLCSPIARCDALIQCLSKQPDDIYIVLDDLHVINACGILDGLSYLLKNLPAHVHLLIASRGKLELSLGNLKLNQAIMELDQEHLVFSREEIGQFYRAFAGVECSEEKAEELETLTEGWVAGVKIALLTERNILNDECVGCAGCSDQVQRQLYEYFALNVMNGLQSYLQNMLLQSAVLPKFNAEALNHVLAIRDGQQLIEYLSESNLFVKTSRLSTGVYQYHPLFREFLLERLATHSGEEWDLLVERAVTWLLEQGELKDAMALALKSNDAGLLESTYEHCCYEWLRDGCFDEVIAGAQNFSEAYLVEHRDVAACLICALIFSRKFNQAEYYIEELFDGATLRLNSQQQEELLAYRTVLSSLLDFLKNNMRNFDGNQYAMSFIKIQNKKLMGLKAFRSVVDAYYNLQHSQLDDAKCEVEKATTKLGLIKQTYLHSFAELVLILSDQRQGSNFDAKQRAEQAFEKVKDSKYTQVWLNAATALAVVRYEENRIEEAKELLAETKPMLSSAGVTEIITASYTCSARIASIEGDSTKAMRLLDYLLKVLSVGNYDCFTAVARHELMLTALLHKRLDVVERVKADIDADYGAIDLLSTCEPEYGMTWDRYVMCNAYYYFAKEEYLTALAYAQMLAEKAKASNFISRYSVAYAFSMVCLSKLGRFSELDQSFREFYDQLSVSNYNRSLFDEAPGFSKIFCQKIYRADYYSVPNSFSSSYGDVLQEPAVVEENKDADVMETELTDREKSLLMLLTEGYSNKEISNKCDIALSTTKWHFKNIYTKLNAKNRTEAALKAKQLGLLA